MDAEHTWVLLTHPDGPVATAVTDGLREAGYEAYTCTGPTPGTICSLLEDGECPIAKRAMVIVDGLPASDEGHDELARAMRDLYPGTTHVVIDRDPAVDLTTMGHCVVLGRGTPRFERPSDD